MGIDTRTPPRFGIRWIYTALRAKLLDYCQPLIIDFKFIYIENSIENAILEERDSNQFSNTNVCTDDI